VQWLNYSKTSATLQQLIRTFLTKEEKNMTLEEIRAALQDRKISVVARATSIHPNTIRSILNDPEANPTHRVVKALSDYLSAGVRNG
jgi:DNA-directed RNA polymerase subunit F